MNKISFALVLLLLFSWTLMEAVDIYGYDFGSEPNTYTTAGGTNTSFFKTPLPTGGGTYGVYMSGSGGGGFYLQNPGLQNFGAGTELRIAAPSSSGSGGVNKFSITKFSPNNNNSYFKAQLRFGNSSGGYADNGTFYLMVGASHNGNSIPASFTGNGPYALNDVFLGLQFVYGLGGTITCNYLNQSGAWTAMTSQAFEQGRNYLLELRLNNGPGGSSGPYTINGVVNEVQEYHTDIFVNGQLIADEVIWAGQSNKRINSFMFYGEGSTANTANLFIDGLTYTDNVAFVSNPNFWSKSSGSLHLPATWGNATNGTGTAPPNFTTAGQGFYIHNNPSPTLTADWTVSGGGTLVSLGDGINPITFTIPSTYAYYGSIDVLNDAILDIKNTSVYPLFGVLYPGSTVRYSAAGAQTVLGYHYDKLSIQGGGTKTLQYDVDVDTYVEVGDDSNPVSFLVPAGSDIMGTVNVLNNGTLDLQNTTETTFGTLSAGSRVKYSATGDQTVYPGTYHYLDAVGTGVKLLSGNVTANLTTVGDGLTEVTLRVPMGYSINGTIDVNQYGILDIMGPFSPSLGTLADGSTVRYAYPGDQDVSGNVYYTMDVDNGFTKTLTGDVDVRNLNFTNGYLALNGNTLHFIDKDIYFYSTDAVFSALAVERYEDGIANGIPRRWSSLGSLTGTVTLTMRYPEALSASDQMGVWYKEDGGEWIKLGNYPATLTDGYRYVSVPNLSSIGTPGKGSYQWTLGEVDDTLPVELSSFTATNSAQNTVNIAWITQSETNVSGYQIYRYNQDNLQEAILISDLIPATNTSVEQSYFYRDTTIYEAGQYYYWLQNLDLDGSSAYHGPVLVSVEIYGTDAPSPGLTNGFNKIYPNPFNPVASIEIGLEKDSQVSLDIYNVRGQIVSSLVESYLPKGNHDIRFEARDLSGRDLPSGIYHAVLKIDNEVFRQKLVLLK